MSWTFTPFSPKEIPSLLDDYFAECLKENIFAIRIIHGKGSGVLKKRVHSLLKKNPKVDYFESAPPEAGGWGATIVTLKKR